MYDEAALTPLVEGLYEAMLDDAMWPQVLSDIARCMHAHLPTLFFHDTRVHSGSLGISVGVDDKSVDDYRTYYASRNVWLRGGAHLLDEGNVRTSHMMCSAREYARSEWYSDWCRPLGISQGLGATILKNASQTSNIALMAGPGRADFGAQDVSFMRALLPHLRRALKVHLHRSKTLAQARSLEALANQLAVAVFLISPGGLVSFMNGPAQRLVAARDGIWVEQGALKTLRSSDTAKLGRLIQATASPSRGPSESGGTLYIPRLGGRVAFEVLVVPITGSQLGYAPGSGSVAVYVSDPALLDASIEAQLSTRHGLTPAQAQVASVICRGYTARDAAELLGVRYNTVKSHLKQIFLKTGVGSQGQLIRLLAHRSTFMAPE